MVVIAGCGGYVPLYRIERETVAAQAGGSGRGESAVPARDENHVTMACEAAGTALARADLDGGDLGAVFAASVTDPLAEHGIAAHVAYRFDATGDVRTGDFRATPRAAADALFAARAFVESTGERALVVASDVLPAEPGDDGEASAGAGAGAVVLADDGANADATDTPATADDDAPAATLTGWGQETTGFVERHREHGEPAVGGDARFERRYGARPAAEAAVERALAAAESPARAVACAPDARLARTVLGGVEAEHVSTFDAVGSAGTASLLLDLAHLLETSEPGTPALAVCYGAGGADAVAFEVGDRVERGGDVEGDEASRGGPTVAELLDAKEYVTYAKHLEYREPVEYQGVNRA
ncbi:hypothetical protein ACFQPA_21530 [Halomarina halobia]|uniref:Hydroxymethylglutaryl-CoA synthase n=1 Tax=Halomarina halobia TaxID=3033386 RepID=A0ABD6AF98_9EURY|nr:hypothetical protein [Halomarina sp. PSR21]